MSEFTVPDFDSLESFSGWVKELKDKEIQSWTTENWLQMYEKMEAFVASDAFTKEYKQKVPQLIAAGQLYGTPESFDTVISDPTMRKFVFTSSSALDLAKLYRNYRFEPEQLNYIKKIAREAGEKLAKEGNVDAAILAIPVRDRELREKKLVSVTHRANNIAKNSTAYETFVNTEVEINSSIPTGDGGPVSANTSKIRLNPTALRDRYIETGFHEAGHVQFQTQSLLQQELMEKGIYAHPVLGEKFQKLMYENRQFYLHPDSINKSMSYFAVNIPYSQYRTKYFTGYKKEPMERYSVIYGIEAERAYRRVSGQVSERVAMNVADRLYTPVPPVPGTVDALLKSPPCIGLPTEAAYTDNNTIKLTYKPEDMSLDELEKKIKDCFVGADEKLIEDLNIRANKTFGEVTVDVPLTYDFSRRYNQFISTPPPPPPLPMHQNVSEKDNLSRGTLSRAKAVVETIEQQPHVGRPVSIKAEDEHICFVYDSKTLSADQLMKNIQKRFQSADKDLSDDIHIVKNENGQISVTVPDNYMFEHKLRRFRETVPPPIPEMNHTAAAPQIGERVAMQLDSVRKQLAERKPAMSNTAQPNINVLMQKALTGRQKE